MTNGVDKAVLDRWTREILRVHDKLDDQKMDNLRICKEIREPLNDLYEAASNAGLGSKAFKAHIKAELAKRAYEKRLSNIEPEDEDDAAIYAMMREIATPGDLFDAAAKSHEAKDKASKKRADNSKTIDSLADNDDDKHVAANVTALSGIKQLPN